MGFVTKRNKISRMGVSLEKVRKLSPDSDHVVEVELLDDYANEEASLIEKVKTSVMASGYTHHREFVCIDYDNVLKFVAEDPNRKDKLVKFSTAEFKEAITALEIEGCLRKIPMGHGSKPVYRLCHTEMLEALGEHDVAEDIVEAFSFAKGKKK